MKRFTTSMIAGVLLVSLLYWLLAGLSQPTDRDVSNGPHLRPVDVLLEPSKTTPISPLPLRPERRIKPTAPIPIVPPSALTEIRDETPSIIFTIPDSPRIGCEPSCNTACLGIVIHDPQELGLTAGAFVFWIYQDSPAERAGFQGSDIIVELNDHRINSYEQIPIVVSEMRTEEPFQARVFRDGRHETLRGLVGKMQNRACLP